MKYLLFTLMILSGCATLKTAGKNFDPTNSICADGILVNIDHAGCRKIHSRQVPGTSTLKIHCEVRKKLSPWTTNTFYLVPYYDRFSNSDAFPICSDPLVEAFFIEPYMMDQYDHPPATPEPDPEPEDVPDPAPETSPETESDTDPEPEDDQ